MKKITRRQFLYTGAAAAATLAVGGIGIQKLGGNSEITVEEQMQAQTQVTTVNAEKISKPFYTGNRPNIMVIISDDMGFSDLGSYGGEIDTPNLDALAANGLRFTQFYNTARCSPSRASLLTGLHPHQTGVGILVTNDGPEGYLGTLNNKCVTMAEVLKLSGYGTYMSGKWHLAQSDKSTWPKARGFDHFYGITGGGGSYYEPNLVRDDKRIGAEARNDKNYYFTDGITENAVKFLKDHADKHHDKPFFQYVAYTAPHWPLHARPEDITKYKGRFNEGWDKLRQKRLQRMVEMGIIKPAWKLSERDPEVPAWENEPNKSYFQRCMEVYAAQIDRMDQGIGQIMNTLKETGQFENTIIFFLQDNGGCAELIGPGFAKGKSKDELTTKDGKRVRYGNLPNVMPGAADTFQSYGIGWANMSNTPFRYYKHYIHEGGISTPLIVHWPKGISDKGNLRHTPGQLTDIMTTVLEITGAEYPKSYKENEILPPEGQSLAAAFSKDIERGPMFWEHEGNAAVRQGKWKLVRKYPDEWELFDLEADRTELNNMASKETQKVADMSRQYEEWAKRCNVIPRNKILELRQGKEEVIDG